MPQKFNKVCIIGVGLIGGSIGLAIKKQKLAKWVVGVVRRKETAITAIEKKVLDVATFDLASGLKGADLVILCAPVSVIIKQMPLIKSYLGKKTLVIDVGSSKQAIEKAAAKYLRGKNFVGCHPMAGLEKVGVEHASADLFQNSICFMTKNDSTIKKLWQSLGSRPILTNAKEHDAWVARVSHLPHLLSFTLFQNFGKKKFPANPSVKEMARLAKSDPALWADIFLSNRDSLFAASKEFQKNLSAFQSALKSKNSARVTQFIENANKHSF